MKVWAKIMRGDKILRDVVYEDELSLSEEEIGRASCRERVFILV